MSREHPLKLVKHTSMYWSKITQLNTTLHFERPTANHVVVIAVEKNWVKFRSNVQ